MYFQFLFYFHFFGGKTKEKVVQGGSRQKEAYI